MKYLDICLQILVDLATPSTLMDSLRAAAEGVIKANPNEFNGTLSVNLNSGTNPLKMTVAVGLLRVLLLKLGSYPPPACACQLCASCWGHLCEPCPPCLPGLPRRSIGNTATAGQTAAALGALAPRCMQRYQRQWPQPAPGAWAAIQATGDGEGAGHLAWPGLCDLAGRLSHLLMHLT